MFVKYGIEVIRRFMKLSCFEVTEDSGHRFFGYNWSVFVSRPKLICLLCNYFSLGSSDKVRSFMLGSFWILMCHSEIVKVRKNVFCSDCASTSRAY